MLTYQLQSRVLRTQPETPLAFPGKAEIRIDIEPREPFGTRTGRCRTAAKSTAARAFFNANNGSSGIETSAGFDPVDVTYKFANMQFVFKGHECVVTSECADAIELHNLLTALQCLLPPLLSVRFYDATFIVSIGGNVDGRPFTWEYSQATGSFDVTTTEIQEQRLVDCIHDFAMFNENKHRRLFAALYYFSVACRLMQCGNGPWEFMAETILNFSKCLEVLFGNTRDALRQGLRKVGVPDSKIERVLVPISILRNDFDVGHVSLSIHKQSDLDLIYRYLETCETDVRNLLLDLLLRAKDGKLPDDTASDLSPDGETLRRTRTFLDRLRASSSEVN